MQRSSPFHICDCCTHTYNTNRSDERGCNGCALLKRKLQLRTKVIVVKVDATKQTLNHVCRTAAPHPLPLWSGIFSRNGIWPSAERIMATLFRFTRFLSPFLRKRCIAISLVIFFVLYIYLLDAAQSAHASSSAFSPTCQPVATESSRAIQILIELQVSSPMNLSSQFSCRLTEPTGAHARAVRVRKLRFFKPVPISHSLIMGTSAASAMALKT